MKCLTYCWIDLYRPEIAKMKTTTVENVLRCIFHKYKNSLHGSTTSSASIGVSASSSSVVDTILDMDVEDKQDMEYGYTSMFHSTETTTFDKELEIDAYLLDSLDNSNFNLLYWQKQNER